MSSICCLVTINKPCSLPSNFRDAIGINITTIKHPACNIQHLLLYTRTIAGHSPGDFILKFGHVGHVELDQELQFSIAGTLLVVFVQLLTQGLASVHPAHVIAFAWILESKVIDLQMVAETSREWSHTVQGKWYV